VDVILFVGLNAVFLRSDKIEERLGTSIEFMKFPFLALGPSLFTTILVEDGEEERAVVQSAVLDRVVQLGHLKTGESENDAEIEGDDVTHPRRIEPFLRNITEVREKFLPTFAEEPRFVPAAPIGVVR